MTEKELAYLLRSDSEVEMPLLQERVNNLQEAGKVLKEKFDGSFVNCIKKCGGSAQKLLSLVVSNFSSYRDEAMYKDKTVAIYKRAQILIADIWSCFEGQGYGSFDDISSITMFADYRIPQALLFFGALEYSQPLLDKINNNHMFTSGEREEVEIRGCSIWAVKVSTGQSAKFNIQMKTQTTARQFIETVLFKRQTHFCILVLTIHMVECVFNNPNGCISPARTIEYDTI
ncbi:C9orf64 [Branchiostoma lanceolatum]|nr:C9orf64 [Branchiostoma lanceolatum]